VETESAWICAQTRPLLESQALRHLNNQKYESFFPFYFEKTKTKKILRPLFPGYLFVKLLEDQPWMPLNNTYGIHRVMTRKVGDYTIPHVMPTAFMESISRRIISADRWLGQEIDIGTRVRVTKGALADQEALVRWKKEDRIRLMFAIMGREVEVEFSMDDIAVV